MARVVQSSQSPAASDVVQPMPPLGSDQLAALREDIAAHGVLVPITVDQHGRIIDGNNRAAIAAELGLECPRVEVEVENDDAAIDLALTLNCARRHLTQEQKRDLIRSELVRRPNDSDRAISRRVGCSPTTVGAVRKMGTEGVPSNLDATAMSSAQAEEATRMIRESLEQGRGALYALAGQALTNRVPQMEVVGALTMARLRYAKRTDHSEEGLRFWLEQVFDYVIEVASWPETLEQFPPHPDSDPTPDERRWLLDSIVMMGDQDHPADLVGAE